MSEIRDTSLQHQQQQKKDDEHEHRKRDQMLGDEHKQQFMMSVQVKMFAKHILCLYYGKDFHNMDCFCLLQPYLGLIQTFIF